MYPLKVVKIFNSGTPSGLTVKPEGILTTPKRRRFGEGKMTLFCPFRGELNFFKNLWDKLQIFKNNCSFF
jgi:hypothetical protein